MTRGRHPDLGRALAEPVAKRRGTVHMIEPEEHTLLDLVITGPGSLSAVTIRRAHRLRAPVTALEAEFSDLVSEVRMLPCGGRVSREIWWYNRDGRLRFFSLAETGLVELAADGMPLPAGTTNAKRPGGQKTRTAAPAAVPAGDYKGGPEST